MNIDDLAAQWQRDFDEMVTRRNIPVPEAAPVSEFLNMTPRGLRDLLRDGEKVVVYPRPATGIVHDPPDIFPRPLICIWCDSTPDVFQEN